MQEIFQDNDNIDILSSDFNYDIPMEGPNIRKSVKPLRSIIQIPTGDDLPKRNCLVLGFIISAYIYKFKQCNKLNKKHWGGFKKKGQILYGLRNQCTNELKKNKAIELLKQEYITLSKKYESLKEDVKHTLSNDTVLPQLSKYFNCNVLIHNVTSGIDKIIGQFLMEIRPK